MPRTAADIRNVILLTVATFAAGYLVLLGLPYVGMPLAGFALGWLSYRFGWRAASALALVASVPMAFLAASVGLSALDAVYVAVTLLAIGPGSAWALRRYPAYTVVAGVTLVTAGAFLAAPIGAQTLHDSLAAWKQILAAIEASGGIKNATSLTTGTAALLTQMSQTWPATTVYTMGIGALLGVPLVGRAGRGLGQQVERFPALADVDLTFHLVWPSIAGLAMLAGGTVWGGGKGLVYVIGYNALMIVRPALTLQGLAVFGSLYRRIGAGRVWRGFGYVLLVLTELVIPSVSVIGVVDLFFNLRKLPRSGAVAQEL